MSAIKLPVLTRKIEISLGTDSSETEHILVVHWRRQAITVTNLPRLKELEEETSKRTRLKRNQDSIEHNNALDAFDGAKTQKAKAALTGLPKRFALLAAELSGLENTLIKAREEVGGDEWDAASLQIQKVHSFLTHFEKVDTQVAEELEAAIKEQRDHDTQEEVESSKSLANLLEYVCESFKVVPVKGDKRQDAELIPATAENFLEFADQILMRTIWEKIIEDIQSPLVHARTGAR